MASCSNSCTGVRSCGPPSAQALYSAGSVAPPMASFSGYAEPASPFRRLCFQAPFQTSCDEPSVACFTTYSTRSGALYPQECASGRAINGQCASFGASVPRAVSSASEQDLAAFAGLSGAAAAASAASGPRCANPLVLVEQNGTRYPVCPIPTTPSTMPQCQQAIQQVWQCDRFKGQDSAKYSKCKQLESCFVYDTVFPTPGNPTQPVSVRATPECMAAAKVALGKVAGQCANCPQAFT